MSIDEFTPRPVRRVITGHSREKQAIVVKDDIASIVRPRGQASSTTIWCENSIPAKVEAQGLTTDGATIYERSGAPANGLRFMIMDLAPGYSGKMHRTNTLDVVLCLEGEVKMLLTESTVTLKPGDVLVQRSTEHTWSNAGLSQARLAIVLIDAMPLGPGFPAPR
jgi:quercetin dioxygenase-like cupin family protein